MSRVIAAFPATGKTFYAERTPGVLDSDSSAFSWKSLDATPRERHPEWPDNYVRHIVGMLDSGATVLVSTHAEVRAALAASGIPFTLVYPDPSLREEYRERMQRRGSPLALVAKVIDELWDDALNECMAQEGCDQVVLGVGQYLSDLLPPTAALHGAQRSADEPRKAERNG